MQRSHGRGFDELREVRLETDINIHAEGSVLVCFGDTQVICTASVENTVPHFLRGQDSGWVTAEYSMLPRATGSRSRREAAHGKQGGRTHEIQRLIARSLRGVVDLKRINGRSITIDCDVIQADGGTRTASITGGYVALCLALHASKASDALKGAIAAISVGMVKGTPMLDLDYQEDYSAETDMNLVMNDAGGFIELQGTAEKNPFAEQDLQAMLALGKKGIHNLLVEQKKALHDIVK